MNCSMWGFPVLQHLLELAQTRVHWVGDAVGASHPLLPSSSLVLKSFQCQGLFQWVSIFASGDQILAIKPVASDKGLGPLALRERIPTKTKRVKQVKHLLRGEESTVQVNRCTGGLRERGSRSYILVVAWVIFVGRFLLVSFGRSSWFDWFTVHIWCISGSSHMCTRIS